MTWWGNVQAGVISSSYGHVKGPTRLNLMSWSSHSKRRGAGAARSWPMETAWLQCPYQDCPLFWVRRLLMRSEIVTRCSNLQTRWLMRAQLPRTRSKRLMEEPNWSSVRQILAEATEPHKMRRHGVWSYTPSTEYYSLWQVKHRAGFHSGALAHTNSCRFMSGKQHAKRPFLYMSQCFFSPKDLGYITDESKKGIDYFFAVNFKLV